ncbi:MAG: TorF family putative porin [Desulfobaccales bacterium]
MESIRKANWRQTLTALFVALFLVGGVLGQAAAQGPGEPGAETKLAEEAAKKPDRPEFVGSVDMLSQYVWRGIALSRQGVVFQPSMTISYKGFAVNMWGNFDVNEMNPYGFTNPNRGAAKWNETDFTFSYSKEVIKNLTLTGGLIYYALDRNNSLYDSFEIFGGVAYKFPWFDVGFQVFREVGNLPGWYLSWTVSKSIELPVEIKVLAGKPTLDLLAGWSAELSNSRVAFPTSDGSFYRSMHAGLVSAGLNIPIHKNVNITPKVMYWYSLGGQSTYTLRALSWDGYQNHILGGVSVSTKF